MRAEGRILLGEPEVSGAPDGVEHTRARELGAVAVLGSPLRMEQLRGILRAQGAPARWQRATSSNASARAL